MLFLYRPRQTWMPFALPRGRTQQDVYNRQLQEGFAVDAAGSAAGRRRRRHATSSARLKDLEELRRSGR